uniref:Uncharacterized protein n=1 Tax=uncultured marine virus TaxID=186617 RepID=A0A0F7L319_9VIRU|nr:hypothetical protein [uncultured marine virus]
MPRSTAMASTRSLLWSLVATMRWLLALRRSLRQGGWPSFWESIYRRLSTRDSLEPLMCP